MNLHHRLNALHVDAINYLSIEVLENKGITEPTEQQIRSVEARLKRALKKEGLILEGELKSQKEQRYVTNAG